MRITLADLTPRDLSPAAVARCISMFMRTSEGELRDQIALQGGGGSATWKQEGDANQAHVRARCCLEASRDLRELDADLLIFCP